MAPLIIDDFHGDNLFLSNFHETFPEHSVEVFGFRFHSSEAAYQSQKDPKQAKAFTVLTASQAKRLGKRVDLRDDWDAVKEDVMWEVLQAKFDQNPDLRQKLLDTGDAELIEGNWWGDTYWGVCQGVGRNRLGIMLMHLRDIYRDEM